MTREEAVKALIDMANALCLNPDTSQGIALKMAIKALEQEIEPKTGHWIKYGIPRCGEQHYQCTLCGYYINFGQWGKIYTKEFKYCPNCGGKMVEPRESEDNQYSREKCYECCNKNKSVLDMPCCKCSAENDYIYFNAHDWEYESIEE